MADPDVNAGAEGTETAAAAATTSSERPAEPNASIEGLQRVIGKKDKELKTLREELKTLKGNPTADEELEAAREEAGELRKELTVLKLKADFPELHDVIDVAVAEGSIPSRTMLETLKKRSEKKSETRPETSGLRNGGGARQTEEDSEDARTLRILKNSKLWP